MRKLHLCCIFLLLQIVFCCAQTITGIATRWSDAFSEWVIYTDQEDIDGELSLRWPNDNNWTEWRYRIGEETGTIRVKWPGDPNEWELRGGNRIITMRTVWNNDRRHWRISSRQTFTMRSRYGNTWNEWLLERNTAGTFEVVAAWENDPRDWNVYDNLDASVDTYTKIAMLFIAIFNSVPKW